MPDNIKDMWEPPHVETGIPPLLTMPGVQSPNDLVNYLLLLIHWSMFVHDYAIFIYAHVTERSNS